MIGERTRRLFGLIAAAFAVLFVRLAWIQIGEHEVWAEQAARLVHSGRIIPYERGAITDAAGTVLARDVQAYELSFEYRPFRRDHPLGQVAHARTALEVRAVTYGEASRNLERWAEEIVDLVPAGVEAFARGGPLLTVSLDIPAVPDPAADARGGRAQDLRFYVRKLLQADSAQWARVLELSQTQVSATYLELFSAVCERDTADVGRELKAGWARSLADLEYLAGEIEVEGAPDTGPFEHLLELLEDSRRAVEGAAASALFEEAAGFPAGRVAPETLLAAFDLEELRLILRWDARDLEDWAQRTRARWRSSWRDGYALPRLVEQLTLDPAMPPDADRVVSMLAALFGSSADLERALGGDPLDWRELDELGVFRDLGQLFRVDLPPEFDELGSAVLPWQDERLRALAAPAPWELLDDVRLAPPAAPPAQASDGAETLQGTAAPAARLSPEPWTARWQRSLASNSADARAERYELARELVEGWEGAVDAALASALGRALAAARPADLGPGGGMLFSRGRLDRVEERAAYIQKDYGGRPRKLEGSPSYDVVYLLAAFPERYPGFEACDARLRERVTLEGDERPLAEALIGSVSRADVRTMQRQRADERRLAELRAKADRSDAEEDELEGLVESVLLPEEKSGVSGVEGFFDPELRGHNGYREDLGLADVLEASSVKEALDGLDVRLTLVAGLQRAGERVINHPEVPDDAKYDPGWYAEPVGAIVMITAQGDVLVAASAPLEDGASQPAIERTLRVPTFQPPGSSLKPFMASYALDAGLDPQAMVECTVMPDGHCGYVDVRCWYSTGHGRVNLSDALMGSCNAYFAWLGEQMSVPELHAAAHAFGFGEPTGVCTPPLGSARQGKRGGLLENASDYIFKRDLRDSERRRATNGLAVVEATPMQVARATAGLATGRLPELRLVSAVGGKDLPRAEPRAVPISARSLEAVRAALLRVTQDPDGTAYKALNASELGFVLAAKTGSADLVGRSARDDDGRVRKHAWVTAYAPPEDPAFVLVVFIHDTSATSSHGAVYVARQFLDQPEVRAFLAASAIAEGER